MKKILLLVLFSVSSTLIYGQSEKEEAWEKFFYPKNICNILGVSTKSDLEKEYGEVTLSKYSPQDYPQLYWGSLFRKDATDVTLLLQKSTNVVVQAEVKGMSPEKYYELVKKFRAYGFKDVKLPHRPLEIEKNGIVFSAVPYNSDSYWIECRSVEKMKGSDVIEGGFDLMPTNMQNYLGKVNREQFEKIVGHSIGVEPINLPGGEGLYYILYSVMNTYTKDETGIRCVYRKSDGKLISVRFPTRYWLGYCIDFGGTKEGEGVKGFIDEKTNTVWKKDVYENPVRIDYKVPNFGMSITDINIKTGTCIINYHI